MSITLGDTLPAFSLIDQYGAMISSEIFKGTPLVVYFYPKNFTPGCTKEACSFRDQFQDFTDLGAKVVGISGNSEVSHQKFAKKYRLPFTLLSDQKGKVKRAFGVKATFLGMLPGRETFVFDKTGVLIYKFQSLNAQPHIEKSLQQLKKLV